MGGPDIMADMSSDTGVSYASAMAELEQILAELEASEPDVDKLAERVQRASTLIAICRQRITNAGIQVERVVAALQSDDST